MLKYFYYIWNLLKDNERIEFFYHIGQCLLASLLFTITDWQYLTLMWVVTQVEASNIIFSIIGVQLFTLIIGFWYYFIKYKILTKQNYFYKILYAQKSPLAQFFRRDYSINY